MMFFKSQFSTIDFLIKGYDSLLNILKWLLTLEEPNPGVAVLVLAHLLFVIYI